MLNRMKLENFKAWREADLTLGVQVEQLCPQYASKTGRRRR